MSPGAAGPGRLAPRLHDRPVRRRRALACAALLGLLAACSLESAPPEAPPPGETAASVETAPPDDDGVLWLCAPEIDDDPCDERPETVAVLLDGSVVDQPWPEPVEHDVDCLYVYPTVSDAPGANAPLEATAPVVATVQAQAARFTTVCDVHVPVYRQLTRGSILSGEFFAAGPRDIAYSDVLAAWQALLARDPERGVVLIGHSQGAMMLSRLLAEQVSGRPEVQRRLVSALLIGGGNTVPVGQDAGGDTGDVPVCREVGQTGCVVAYSSFSEVPPPDAYFGRAPAGREAVCTDPSRLAGGDGTLTPVLPSRLLGRDSGSGVPPPRDTVAELVVYPGAVRAECRAEDGASWLQVTPVPGAPLPAFDQRLGPGWGLHVVDVNLALDDLVELVRRQAAAF